MGFFYPQLTPPKCLKHDEQMVLYFYERPDSPPGNNWFCHSCAVERENEIVQSKAKSKKARLELQLKTEKDLKDAFAAVVDAGCSCDLLHNSSRCDIHAAVTKLETLVNSLRLLNVR